MSFQIPGNVPSFTSSQRLAEDSYWRASQRSQARGGPSGLDFSEKITNFINPERDLPMYKDKPYFATRRTRKRRKAAWVGGILVLGVLVWWLLFGGRGAERVVPGFKGRGGMQGGELWKWVQSFERPGAGGAGAEKKVDWAERRERVKDAFLVSWEGYEQDAWGHDIYEPISRRGRDMIEGGMGWIIVDALDTLMIMNLTTQVQHARNWIHTSLRYNQNHAVNTFETTIRMLGGLLSAHYLSTTYPNLAPLPDDDEGAPGEDLYIEKATDLADRLLGAFDSKSGVPFASVNLNTSQGIRSHTDGGASSTSEATTVQLEFKYLAKLTGEANYWETVEKVMQVVEANGREDGLLPIYIYADTGKFMGENIRLGSRGDSYYEYLIKQYLQTSAEEPIYKELWDESLAGIRKHLITYSKHASLTVLAERPSGLHKALLPKMDHLACFMPGTIALGTTGGLPISEARKLPTWGRKQEEEILLAKELMKTCWATYLATATGLAGEISYFEIDDPPRMMKDMFPEPKSSQKKKLNDDLFMVSKPLYPLGDKNSPWRKDIKIHANDRHNLQRPETVESLFYMYRILEDDTYRHWGWEMFKNFIKHTAVIDEEEIPSSSSSEADRGGSSSSSSQPVKKPRIRGFTSLSDANTIPAVQRDNMESFWMAETLKYFYLLFSERTFLPLEDNVLNTEAHIFPRFKMGELFKTGWKRAHPWKGDEGV